MPTLNGRGPAAAAGPFKIPGSLNCSLMGDSDSGIMVRRRNCGYICVLLGVMPDRRPKGKKTIHIQIYAHDPGSVVTIMFIFGLANSPEPKVGSPGHLEPSICDH